MSEQEKREAVIKEFKDNYRPYSPSYAHVLVRNWAIRDAIDLLKAQEPLGVLQKELGCTSGHVGYCPKCGAVLLENDYNPKYCGVCGQAVKWE